MAHSVLVVEDDDALRRLIVRMLAAHGFETFQSAEADQALSFVRNRQKSVNLAIIDMVMPGVSGLDFAATLEREHPSVKILYISGYVDSLAVEVIARRSPEVLLLKPFTESALIDRVNLLLQAPPRIQPGTAGSSTVRRARAQ